PAVERPCSAGGLVRDSVGGGKIYSGKRSVARFVCRTRQTGGKRSQTPARAVHCDRSLTGGTRTISGSRVWRFAGFVEQRPLRQTFPGRSSRQRASCWRQSSNETPSSITTTSFRPSSRPVPI